MSESDTSVRVALRMRPLLPHEINQGSQECVQVFESQNSLTIGSKSFTFDSAFSGAPHSQDKLYTTCISPLLSACFEGYNATVLAYGQTGSGKTFTMGTDGKCSSSTKVASFGVVPRIAFDIFEQRKALMSQDKRVDVSVSFLELYQEDIRDLLGLVHAPALDGAENCSAVANAGATGSESAATNTDANGEQSQPGASEVTNKTDPLKRSTSSSSGDRPTKKPKQDSSLHLREDASGNVVVPGLQQIRVDSFESLLQMLRRGSANRVTGSTKMNAASSRSHAIFTIHLTVQTPSTVMTSKLHLVDLAGSERAKRTKAQGKRFQEGVNINKGLLALGNVISALGDEKKRAAGVHVPYRDSKLTRMLQSSLGGNSRTLMIACASPADINLDETMNTLKYANRARNIKNKLASNLKEIDGDVASLRATIESLREQLQASQGVGKMSPSNSMPDAAEIVDLTEKTVQMELSLKRAKQAIFRFQLEDNSCETPGSSTPIDGAENDIAKLLESVKMELDNGLTVMNHASVEQPCLVQNALTNSASRQDNVSSEETRDGEDHGVAPTTADVRGVPPPPDAVALAAIERNQRSEFAKAELKYHERQEAMMKELQEIDRALDEKNKTIAVMETSQDGLDRLKKVYHNSMANMSKQIEQLQSEKERILKQQKNAPLAASKPTSDRLEKLELQLAALKRKHAEQAKLLKLQEKGISGATRLKEEIVQLKQTKVRLVRKIKQENDEFQRWKREKEREIRQLKSKESKQKYQYSKLERKHEIQEIVLKRKTEQVSAVQRRLRDALQKQRDARKMNQNKFRRVPGPAREGASGDKKEGPNKYAPWFGSMKQWIEGQVELVCTSRQARRTLKEEISKRREVVQQIRELETQRGNDESVHDQLRKLIDEREKHSTRIADLQSLLLAADDCAGDDDQLTEGNEQHSSQQQASLEQAKQERRDLGRWLQVRTTREAKMLLAHMFRAFVHSKDGLSRKLQVLELEKDESEASYEAELEQTKELTQQLAEMRYAHANEMREQEEKNLVLMEQLGAANEAVHKSSSNKSEEVDRLQATIHLQNEKLKEHAKLVHELNRVKDQRDEVESELEAVLRKQEEKKLKKQRKKEEKKRQEAEEEEDDQWWDDAEASDGVEAPEADDDDPEWTEDSPRTRKKKSRNASSSKRKQSSASSEASSSPSDASTEQKLPSEVQRRVSAFKVKELQDALFMFGLSISGRKDTLKARLLHHLQELQAGNGDVEILPTVIPDRVVKAALAAVGDESREVTANGTIKKVKHESKIGKDETETATCEVEDDVEGRGDSTAPETHPPANEVKAGSPRAGKENAVNPAKRLLFRKESEPVNVLSAVKPKNKTKASKKMKIFKDGQDHVETPKKKRRVLGNLSTNAATPLC